MGMISHPSHVLFILNYDICLFLIKKKKRKKKKEILG